jgi:hypothetical protein
MNRLLIISIVLCLTFGGATALSQEGADSRIPYAFTPDPMTSEFNIIRLEFIAKDVIAVASEGKVTILVARLGNGERSREVNRRRLHNVRTFLTVYSGLNVKNIIAAEGDRVQGFGRVEIYVGGKLVDVMLAEKNKDIEVECCEGDERYYPHKDLMRRGRRRR